MDSGKRNPACECESAMEKMVKTYENDPFTIIFEWCRHQASCACFIGTQLNLLKLPLFPFSRLAYELDNTAINMITESTPIGNYKMR